MPADLPPHRALIYRCYSRMGEECHRFIEANQENSHLLELFSQFFNRVGAYSGGAAGGYQTFNISPGDTPEMVSEFLQAVLGEDADDDTVVYVWENRRLLQTHGSLRELVQRTKNVNRILEENLDQHHKLRHAEVTNPKLFLYECIIRNSTELKHDLKEVTTGAMTHSLSAELLEAYYAEGYHYIYDLSHFPGSFGTAPAGKDTEEELSFLQGLAKRTTYPALEEQKMVVKMARKAKAFPFGTLTRVYLHFFETETDVKSYYVFLDFLSRFSSTSAPQIDAVSHMERLAPTLLKEAHVVLHDIMSQDQPLCDELCILFCRNELDVIQQKLFRRRLKEHAEKFPEKPLEEVRAAFDREGEEGPPKKIMDEAFATYQRIVEEGASYTALPDLALMQLLRSVLGMTMQVNDFFGTLSWQRQEGQNGITEEQKITFFALLRELFKREFGIYPFNTQMIAVILMNTDLSKTGVENCRGIFEEIKTGEGKSLIFALQAAFLAVQGRRVDVLTSNDYLAGRDLRRFSGLFAKLGLSASAFRYGMDGGASIRYSTSADVAFSHMRCEGSQHFDVCLLDESDYLAVDRVRDGFRISCKETAPFSDKTLEEIMAIADSITEDGSVAVNVFEEPARAVAMARLIGRENPEITKANPLDILRYLVSAVTSRSLEKGVDYVLHGPEGEESVCIVDHANTGRLMPQMLWENGLHHFVALREGIRPPAHTGLMKHISTAALLNRYRNMFWITGTAGDPIEREEIRSLFGMTGWNIPPHHPNQRIDRPIRVVERKQGVLDHVSPVVGRSAAQPILLIAGSIRAAIETLDLLKDQGLTPQLVTDHDNKAADGSIQYEEELVKQSGEVGAVTVSTNTMGRGTDIVLTRQAVQEGGLHVLGLFIPGSHRVEYQARGRAGRQGQAGISEIVASFEDDPFIQGLSNEIRDILFSIGQRDGFDSDAFKTALELVRRCESIVESLHRRIYFTTEEVAESGVRTFLEERRNAFYRLKAPEFTHLILWLWMSRHEVPDLEEMSAFVSELGKETPDLPPSLAQLLDLEGNTETSPDIQKIFDLYKASLMVIELSIRKFSADAAKEFLEQLVFDVESYSRDSLSIFERRPSSGTRMEILLKMITSGMVGKSRRAD